MALEIINSQNKTEFFKTGFLYRIYPLTRFIDLLENKFVFVSPAKWNDHYEKAFLEAVYLYNDKSYSHPLSSSNGYKLFAQCWTSGSQTEAMWKGFAPNEDGVMIKIATFKLFEILEKLSDQGMFDFYIGKVNYENNHQLYQVKIDPIYCEPLADQIINQNTLGLLLKKREAFDYEKEYRILAVKKTGISEDYVVSFTIEDLISNVEYIKFDPRMGDSLFEFMKAKIQAQYPHIEIIKSRLYTNPINKLTFNGNLPVEINDELIFQ